MQLLIIRNDGEVHEIKTEKTIREMLSPSESYILCDDETKTIYLWKGSVTSVRSKFIGATKSQEVRGQVGMHYRVIPVDEGGEPPELLKFFSEIPRPGYAKEIREDAPLQFEIPGVTSPAKPKPAAKPKGADKFPQATSPSSASSGGEANTPKQVMGSKQPSNQDGPLYTGDSAGFKQPQSKANFKDIMETLEGLEVPAGYERELIIIGNQAFSIIEKKVSFLGTSKVERSMERITSLPEGVFFARGYAPRVLCENQIVLAIELLKKVEVGAQSSFSGGQTSQKLKPKSKDPRELAKSFGMKVD